MQLNIKNRLKPKEIKPRSGNIVQDLCLNLHNKLITIYDIRQLLLTLDQYEDWAFIVPRRYIGQIHDAYDMEEMPYDTLLSEPNSSQAVLIYQQLDAVMVKRQKGILQ